MSEIRVTFAELGKKLAEQGSNIQIAAKKAAVNAAFHLQAHLMKLSDELGITYSGMWKNSNKVQITEDGAVVYNDAPHAGIVEEGCRPHVVGRDGIDALTSWAMRKLGVKDEKEARGVAFAIAHNIAEHGLKGRFPYRDSQEVVQEFYRQELARMVVIK